MKSHLSLLALVVTILSACATSPERAPSSAANTPPPVFQCDASITEDTTPGGAKPAGTSFRFSLYNMTINTDHGPQVAFYYEDSISNYFAVQNGGAELLAGNPVTLEWSMGFTDNGGPLRRALSLSFPPGSDRSSGTYEMDSVSGFLFRTSWHVKARLSGCH